MIEGQDKSQGRVQPIKFRQIGEEVDNGRQDSSDNQREKSLRRRHVPRPNFTLGPSYPAVNLENVCFSVDKSQQQSNFAKEVLFRLSNCLNPVLSGPVPDNQVQILKSVNLNVPHGSIFGLLGPSSCGKTTLLRCLVGLLKPSSGSIRLFGQNSRPHLAGADHDDAPHQCLDCFKRRAAAPHAGERNCKVPGANVGYMPQDLGLYEDFTIEQLLTMFGRYVRMESQLIRSRIAFMANFLELPDVGRQIQTLSGGQKRRVSFAIACLHMPPLIILDEPTVGVDPLLRQSIWKYLRCLASEENKTIIITTHYIEEAAQADQVALMRAGEILVQDTPKRIMASNQSKSLEEAFLKICNNVNSQTNDDSSAAPATKQNKAHKLFPQPQFNWNDLELSVVPLPKAARPPDVDRDKKRPGDNPPDHATVINELKLRAEEKLALYDKIDSCHKGATNELAVCQQACAARNKQGDTNFSMIPDTCFKLDGVGGAAPSDRTKVNLFKRTKFSLNGTRNDYTISSPTHRLESSQAAGCFEEHTSERLSVKLKKMLILFWALLYKNYRRNVNSIPLLAFQFMLPMIQMISFSICVGGRPTNVGLGIVNHDQPLSFVSDPLATDGLISGSNSSSILVNSTTTTADDFPSDYESLSSRYLSFIDQEMLQMKAYDSLQEALTDVRKAKLWAVLEIGANFSSAISQRFDLDNFYQLDLATIAQSVIKIYPDRSNKILDMICHRSLVDSYRKFLSSEFDHFRRLPIEVARPIFDIEPNAISNSIDGYTESIAPGLLASLTYIMAAGLTTFIMVVERSAGILERTYTSGINPIAYLLAHAIFRSLVMMLQIAAVLVLTFYVLQQPLVGSIWLAYTQLMVLNMTGIAYGLLISSIVTDQNGAALTIVSSLVVKITMSGILWPFEAIPRWLRAICYIQPLTMPVQALKAITLKGATLGDRAVNLGFLVSLTWLLIFLTISTKRFKFYQH